MLESRIMHNPAMTRPVDKSVDNFSGQPVDNFPAVDKLWITFAAKKPQKELTGVYISENEFTGVCIFRKLKKPGCVFYTPFRYSFAINTKV